MQHGLRLFVTAAVGQSPGPAFLMRQFASLPDISSAATSTPGASSRSMRKRSVNDCAVCTVRLAGLLSTAASPGSQETSPLGDLLGLLASADGQSARPSHWAPGQFRVQKGFRHRRDARELSSLSLLWSVHRIDCCTEFSREGGSECSSTGCTATTTRACPAY